MPSSKLIWGINLFNLFKPKKSMDTLLSEHLALFGETCDPLYDSYFQSPGENPCCAKLAWALSYLIKEESPHQKRLITQNFLKNFYSYLEKKAQKIQSPSKFFSFVSLVYHVYEALAQKSGCPDISPSTTAQSLGLMPSTIICLEDQLGEKTSFKPYFPHEKLKKATEKDLYYFIEVCSNPLGRA